MFYALIPIDVEVWQDEIHERGLASKRPVLKCMAQDLNCLVEV